MRSFGLANALDHKVDSAADLVRECATATNHVVFLVAQFVEVVGCDLAE